MSSVLEARAGATTTKTAPRSRLRATTCAAGIGIGLVLASGLHPGPAGAQGAIITDGPTTIVDTWNGFPISGPRCESTVLLNCLEPDPNWAPLTVNPAGGDQGGAILNLINQKRARNGCGPVASNGQLNGVASRHAKDMLGGNGVSHTGADGSSMTDRIADARYAPVGLSGEIVYQGTTGSDTPESAVNWWMNSPGHRGIITDCRYFDVGVATASGGDKMTAVGVFAKH